MARRPTPPDDIAAGDAPPAAIPPQEPRHPVAADDGAESAAQVAFVKKDLVAAISAATGAKAKAVKPLVDAALSEIGMALARGESLNLPPLGKISVNRTKQGDRADVLILKLRRVRFDAPPRVQSGTQAADDESDADE